MNAPVRAVELAEPKVELIPLTAIAPSETHIQEMRRARFTKDELAELVASIKKLGGVLQPIVVRPLAALRGLAKYELVAGERRWLASKQAGLAHIQASVRVLTDEEVLEVQLVENLQRKGLHELEEAEGYDELMKLKKIGAEQLVAMVGKSKSYVYARLKLLALCPEARKSFYAGELDASRALLIARIAHHDTQRQALKDVTKGRYAGDEAMTYREAHRHILDHYMLALKNAPFDIKDPGLLPKAGDCIKCPKRTGNQADLFGDVKNADVCTDPKCFDDKRQAHYAVARRRLEAAGRKVIAGAEAKKLMPHWANGNDHISRDYVKLDQSEYIGGRYQTPAALLGKDYQAVVIQHPLTGKPIEVAPRSTVAAAAAKRTRQSNARPSSGSSRSARPAAAKPLEPDITELVAGRVVETLIKKPIALDRAALLYIADAESDTWDSGVPDTLCKAFKLPSAGRLRLEKLGDKDLARFIVLGTVHNGLLDGYGSCVKLAAQVCKRHKLDPKKIEKQIRGELKEKAAAGKVTAAAKSSTPTWADKAVHSRGAAVSFTEKYIPSLQLAAAVGPAPIMRVEVTKKIWGYIKKHGLQDKKNKRMINADEKLQPVFGGKKQLSMFEMTKYLSQHLGRKRQAKASAKAKGKKK